MNIQKKLIEVLSQKATSPFFFLGSGFSRRYIGLEKWDELLKVFADKVGKPYGYYKSNANGNLPQVASLIAKDFQDKIWSDEKFFSFREKYGDNLTTDESAFKYAISEYLQSKLKPSISDYLNLSKEIEILQKLNVDSIITTNWDTFIEQLFPSYEVYIGQEELLFSNSILMGEIFKIHGSITEPDSLVVTQKDYDTFSIKNPYLAAKLITIFVEHPIIFIGYSLNDPNIISLISSIVSCLNTEKLRLLQNNLIFIEYNDDPNAIPEFKESSMLIGDTNLPICIVSAYSYEPVYNAINSIQRKIPAKVLRCCKEQFYQLILTQDPQNKMAVIDGNNIDKKSDIEFLWGIGVVSNQPSSIGYKSIGVNEIIKDVLNINKAHLDSDSILKLSIPECQGYVPKYKFLRDVGVNSIEKLKKSPYTGLLLYKKNDLENKSYKNTFAKKYSNKSIADLIKQLDKDKVCFFIIYAKLQSDDIELIGKFLVDNYEHYMVNKGQYRSYYRKLVCYYDLLKYGF